MDKKYKFHHLGIPITEKRNGERYSEHFKMFTTDNKGKFRIQFHRFEEDSPLHAIIKTKPHIALQVDNLLEAIVNEDVILGPYEPVPKYKVAIINDGGMPIELIETALTDEELWGNAKRQNDLDVEGIDLY